MVLKITIQIKKTRHSNRYQIGDTASLRCSRWTDGRKKRSTDKRKEGSRDGQKEGKMGGRKDGQTYERKGGEIDG